MNSKLRFNLILAGMVSIGLASSVLAEVPLTDRQILKRQMKMEAA